MAGPKVLLLGDVELRLGGAAVAVPGRKLPSLLALLALAVPHPVTADRLVEELWGDEDLANPGNALQAQVSHLRRVLGADVVVRRGEGYLLAVAREDIDVGQLEQAAQAARHAAATGDLRGAAQHHRDALALVRGPALASLVDRPFARQAGRRLDELVLGLHEGLHDVLLAAGLHAEAVAPLTELVQAHPLRERFAAQLALALYRSGRQADALRALAATRQLLAEELGVDPGPELRQLEAAVLAHDPSLTLPAVAGTAADADGAAPTRRTIPAFRSTHDELPLLGRPAELALLQRDLDDVLLGRGRIVVISGEPGIGKTRLAEELADLAEAAGMAVAWGRSHDGVTGAPFSSWARAFRTLLERVPAPLVVSALGRGAATIAQVVPEVHDLVPDLGDPPPLDPEATLARLFEAFTATLRALARQRPLLLTIDDVQWADPTSLQQLAFLAREMTDARILVVATLRSPGAPSSRAVTQTLAQLSRQTIARRIELGGLSAEALAELVAAAGAAPGDEVLATMYRRTQGNPFFAVELARLLPPSDALAAPDPEAVRRAIPHGVRDVVRQRLEQLPERTDELLALAAVLGQELDLGLVAAAAGTTAGEVLLGLQPAIDGGIVVVDDGGGLRFSHGLVNETRYADLPAATKAALHLRVAGAFKARLGGAEGSELVDVAVHRVRARPLGDAGDAARAALRAARWAEAHLAHDQAESLLSSALDVLRGLPPGRDRDALEFAVQDLASLVLIVTAGYASEQVARASARMRDLSHTIDDAALLVPPLWRLAINATIATDLDGARDLGEQLLALATSTGDVGARLAGHLALGAVLTHRGELASGHDHLVAARAMLDAGHGPTVAHVVAEGPEVWCGVFSAWNTWLRGDEDEAERLVVAAVAASGPGGGSYGATFATWFSVLVATLRRDPEAVLARCEAGVPAAMAGGFGMFVPYMLVSRGWAVSTLGDHELGAAELLGAAGAVKASGAQMMLHVFPAFHAEACLAHGEHESVLAAADHGLDEVERTGERWFEAELHRLRGEALVRRDPHDAEADLAWRRAVDVASRQGAGALLRRAEASRAQHRAGR